MSEAGGVAVSLVRDALRRHLDLFGVTALKLAVGHYLGLGKLYRPRLLLASFHACGGLDVQLAANVGSALELIHTFSLIHDDLPCMDDADTRRGLPAVHVAHGEANAVLAGDALCSLAYLVAASLDYPAPDACQRIVSSLAQATHEVVEGQVLDLLAEGEDLTADELQTLQRWKTGALLGAACEIGAVLANAPSSTVMALKEIGIETGVLFQIRDDLLSETSTDTSVGKPLGCDVAKSKATAVRVLGREAAEKTALATRDALLRRVAILGLQNDGALLEMIELAYDRDI